MDTASPSIFIHQLGGQPSALLVGAGFIPARDPPRLLILFVLVLVLVLENQNFIEDDDESRTL